MTAAVTSSALRHGASPWFIVKGVLLLILAALAAALPGHAGVAAALIFGWVLVLAGVQLVVVGLIGEYVGRMFLAVNRKPQYLVREVFHRGPSGLEVERPKVDTREAGQPHREPSQGSPER